jgi:SNF2 family DNA or RNA helicase
MKTNRKLIIIISAVLISLAAGSVVWHVARRAKPFDATGKKPEQIFEYLQSDEFRNLDPNTRRDYARQAFGQMMTQRAKEYCELPPEKRTAYLDEVIDSMQSQRREFESRRTEFRRPRDGEPNRRPFNPATRPRRKPEDMRARRELTDPTTRAQMAAFRQAMGERMRQRGITPRGRPPQ